MPFLHLNPFKRTLETHNVTHPTTSGCTTASANNYTSQKPCFQVKLHRVTVVMHLIKSIATQKNAKAIHALHTADLSSFSTSALTFH